MVLRKGTKTPMKKKIRDSKYRKTKQGLKENAARKRARYKLEKEGRVKKHDKKDVDHKNGVKAGNGRKNLRVLSRSENRGRSNRKKK